jgi:hypothetical protein
MRDRDQPLMFLIWFMLLFLSSIGDARRQSTAPSSVKTRADIEAFLLNARIVGGEGPPSGSTRSWLVSLDDGHWKHDAGVETADGSDPTRRNYRLNLAAYELNKVLGLDLVVPSVERLVKGRPASLTWWLDNFSMNELDRRRKGIEPPDPDNWAKQMDAVRVFDELISNTYRDTSPPLYLNTVWDNLLITRGWTIWLTDHTGAFRTRTQLQDPESLSRCDRALLGRLRSLNKELLQRVLGQYLSSRQLDALVVRRELLVKHFDEQIARKGEAAVLYDLPPRQ